MNAMEARQRTLNPFNGISYFFGGSLAIILSWVMATLLSGCRIGNYTSPTTPPDPISGYYDANPQSLQFCVALSSNSTSAACANASPSQIPVFISQEITDPVAIVLQNASTGDAVFTAISGGTTALPVTVGSDDVTLSYTNATTPQTLWKDPTCTTSTYLAEQGSIVPGAGHAVAGSTRLTQGSITLTVQVIQTFDSTTASCTSELQSMSQCYQDVTQCGGTDSGSNQQLQSQVQSLFEPYIQAGAMAASDIPTATAVSYEVHYQ